MLKNYVVIQKFTRFAAVVGLILAVMLTAVPSGVLFAAPTQQTAGPVAISAACTTLQPDETVSMDAWINQDNITDNKNDSELRVKTESGKLNRSLISFDLGGAVPINAKVTSATLSLWVKDVRDGNAAVSAHQVEDYWIEGAVTWRYQDKVSTEEWSNLGGDYSATVLDSRYFTNGVKDYWATFNVSAAAQSWAANPSTNYGVILEGAVTSPRSEIKFKSSADGTASQRPKLEVCWDVGVSVTPDNLAQGTAGQTNLYSHTVAVKDFTGEPVGLSAVSNQGWTVNIYKDVNGDGVKDAGDDPISQTAPLGPNGSTKILVEVVVPANAPNGTKDITTVTVTGLNNGTVDTAKDTTLVGFPPVADPVLDGRRDLAYTQSLDSNTQDYCDASGNTLARLMTLYDAGSPDYVWLVLEMDLAHADNTYGTNAHPSWAAAGKSQTLGNLVGSDKGRVILRDANGSVVFDVTSDYVSTGMPTVSGYGSAGVTGGEGSIAVGNASQVAVETSIGYDLNRFCTSSSSCTVNSVNLFSTSPPVNADYTPVSPFFADWQFPYLYEFRFDRSAFGSAGFGSATIDAVHISPNKTGSNEIIVTPCDGSIGDRVWQDNDGDKIQDGNEIGLNGVMVNLYRDTGNGTFEPGTDLAINTRFTAGDGDYSFTGLGPGTYFVDVVESTIPADYVLTTANEPMKVVLTLGQNYKDADFGYRTLPNIEISKTLISADPAPIGSQVEFSIRITNTGNTVIDVLPLEDIFDPTALQFVSATPAHSSLSNGVVRWADLTTTQGNLAVGASTSVTVRFQALKITATTRRAAILSATAVNAPAAEPLVDGLLESDYSFVGRSDPAGNAPGNLYKYTGADMCYYAFVVDRSFNDNVYAQSDNPYLLLDGWNRTHTYSNLDGSDKAIFTVSGPAGTHANLEMDYITKNGSSYDVSFFTAPINAAKTSLWYNLNQSGWNGNGPSPQYVNGNVEYHSPPYNWNDTLGQYWEWHMIYEFSIPKASVGPDCGTVVLAGAHNSPSKNGSTLGMIGDYVWTDLDANGVQNETAAGIPNVRVNLYQNNILVRTTETEPGTSGFYLFSNLPAGTYVVNVDESTLPVGYTLTTANEPKTVVLAAGQDYRNADFGYVPGQGTIGDRVYYDINGDGGLDNDGEPGINNVKVNLFQGTCPGAGTPFRTLVTTGNGDYDFTMLPAGDYCVNVDESTLPANYSLTTANEPKQVALALDQDYNLADFGYRIQEPGKTCDVATTFGVKDLYGTNPGDKSDFACVTIDSFPGIEIIKVLNGPSTVTVGEEISYTIRLKNNGQTTLVTVPLQDTYDNTKLTFLGATPAVNDAANDGVLDWSDLTASFGQDMATDQTFEVTVHFRTVKTTAGTGGICPDSTPNTARSAGAVDANGKSPDPVQSFACVEIKDRGAIGDFVWYDTNKDGIEDIDEPGIPNVTLDLYRDTDGTPGLNPATDTKVDSTVTDADGGYLFTNLLPGTYFVDVTDVNKVLTGLTHTVLNQSVTDPSPAIVLPSGAVYKDADFGYVKEPGQGKALVGDTVWYDDNGDGVQQPSEPGIPGVTVTIKDKNGAILGTDVTDGNGYYLVEVTAGSGYTAAPTAGVPAGLTATTPVPHLLPPLFSGDQYLDADFGYNDPGGDKLGTIGNFVFNDKNDNGVFNSATEAGLPGVSVDLIRDVNNNKKWDAGEPIITTVTTDKTGGYLFTGVPAGNYLVHVSDTNAVLINYAKSKLGTAGVNDNNQADPYAITLAAGADNLTADFGYVKLDANLGQIGNQVWTETDGNGLFDPNIQDVGQAGVTVDLYRNGSKYATTTTGASGDYSFVKLPSGTYTTSVSDNFGVLNGWVVTTLGPNQGSDDNNQKQPYQIVLPTGGENLTADFGYIKPNVIGDFVWYDSNRDGIEDVGEPGIPNVTLDLYQDVNSNNVRDLGVDKLMATQTTDADGGYLFTGLGPGTYFVDVTDANGELTGLDQIVANQGQPDPTGPIVLTSGTVFKDADFGYVHPNNGKAIVGDTVWRDTNQDGVQQPGEPGIPGVTVTIFNRGNNSIGSAVTDGNGHYFISVDPGSGYTAVPSGAPLSGLTATTPVPHFLPPLAAGDKYLDADFGYYKAGLGTIGNLVWEDADNSGTVNNGELGIPGVSVDLIRDTNGNKRWDTGEPIIDTVTTDQDGGYLFTSLVADNYLVHVSDTNAALYNYVKSKLGSAGVNNNNQADPYAIALAAGANNLTADFGYLQADPKLGKIGNQVWIEYSDGIFDVTQGDFGQPGVTVDLLKDGVFYARTTTGASGDYMFLNLPAGNYTVFVSDIYNVLDGYVLAPLGPVPGADNNHQQQPYDIVLPLGGENMTADFAYTKKLVSGAIGDYVFYDSNKDGIQDVGEPGIGNVTLALYRDNGDTLYDPTQDALVGTKTTDSDGGYLFTGLAPDLYFVDVTDVNGVLNGLDHTLGLQSQPDPSNGIPLVEAQIYRDADFGYVKLTDSGKAIIGDTVWYDGDGDGVQDPGELGIPNITVCATPLGGGTIVCDITDNNGIYQLIVPAGTYNVAPQNPPATYTATTPVPHGPVTVSDGDQYLDADFGYNKPGTLGQISGTIWDDTPNNNGLLEGGETPIPSVSVSLIKDTNGNGRWDDGEPIVATDTTDQSGNYLFDGVPAGKYLVLPTDTQNVLADFQPTVDGPTPGADNNSQVKPYPVNLPAGGVNPTGDFGYVRSNDLGKIGNQVWYEEDGNGIFNQDGGDIGIAGVTVELWVGNTVVATTTTGAGGDYVFTSLAADTYMVRVSDDAKVLEDYILTKLGPNQGNDNNNQAQAYQVILPVAGSNMTADFGYTRPSSIGDFVWYDTDKDGIEDVGEPGIPNVTLDLYRDGIYQATTTTGADGGYIFPGLVAGNYTVDVTDVNDVLTYDDNGVQKNLTQIVANQAKSDPTGTIVLGAGVKYEDADFAYVQPTVPGKAIIGDTVWFDDNGDGVQQPEEPGIPGIQVCATPVGGGTAVCDTTDENGIYRVEVPAGTYTVVPINPPGDLFATTPVPHGPVTVIDGEQYLDADFGYDDTGKNLLGTIGNLVFVEAKATRDGIFNGVDKPLGGVSVDLIRDTNGNKAWDAGEPIIATTTSASATDASTGNYIFTGLRAGNYLVHVSDTNSVLLDYKPTILGPNQRVDNNNQVDPYWVTLGAGGDNLTADFGFYQTERPDVGVIGNQVWLETVEDGFFDDRNSTDVGQAGVTVSLHKDGVLYRTTTTDPSGDYSFVGLPAGNYTVQVTDDMRVLLGYRSTVLGPNQGSDNNNQKQPYAVALPTDGVNLTADFGYLKTEDKYTLTKRLTSPKVARVGEVVSFSIRITNTGTSVLMSLPLVDTYDAEYLRFVSALPAKSSNTEVGASGIITWTDLTVTEGIVNPGDGVEVIVNFQALKDTGELPNDVTINVATVDGVTTDPDGNGPSPRNPTPLPPQTDQDVVEIVNPTAALIVDKQVGQASDGVSLSWRTVSEMNVVGFNLLRTSSDGNVTMLNSSVIPAQNPGQAEGTGYKWLDSTALPDEVYSYALEIMGLDGVVSRQELGSTQHNNVIFLPLVTR